MAIRAMTSARRAMAIRAAVAPRLTTTRSAGVAGRRPHV
jgi:hypothetical protein